MIGQGIKLVRIRPDYTPLLYRCEECIISISLEKIVTSRRNIHG
jgi:hypothetical protein